MSDSRAASAGSRTASSTTSPPGLARMKRPGGGPTSNRDRQSQQRVVNGGVSHSPYHTMRMLDIDVPSFILPPQTSNKHSNKLQQAEQDGKQDGDGRNGGSKKKHSTSNGHARRGRFHDDDVKVLLQTILRGRQYTHCDRYARDILQSADLQTETHVRRLYLSSNIIDEILACLSHTNRMEKLTASLVAVFPYVTHNVDQRMIREISVRYCRSPRFDVLCPALSQALTMQQAVSSNMKAWILHALASIMEERTSGSGGAPIRDQYELVYPCLQILQCPRAGARMQAFAVRILTCELHCGVSARQHLCELATVAVLITLLPTLKEMVGSRPTSASSKYSISKRNPGASTKRRGAGGSFFENEEQDSETRRRGGGGGGVSSSGHRHGNGNGSDMSDYLYVLVIKFLYLCYSFEEFWFYDEPTPTEQERDGGGEGGETAGTSGSDDVSREHIGVWTRHYIETLETKCLRLEKFSPSIDVRAAAAMLLDYPLERKKRNGSYPAAIQSKYSASSSRHGGRSSKSDGKEAESGNPQHTVTVSKNEILGKVKKTGASGSSTTSNGYYNRNHQHHHHSLRHFRSSPCSTGNRPPAWGEKFKAYVATQRLESGRMDCGSVAGSVTGVSNAIRKPSSTYRISASSPNGSILNGSRVSLNGPVPKPKAARVNGASSPKSQTPVSLQKRRAVNGVNGKQSTSSISSKKNGKSNGSSGSSSSNGSRSSSSSSSSSSSGRSGGKKQGKRKSRR